MGLHCSSGCSLIRPGYLSGSPSGERNRLASQICGFPYRFPPLYGMLDQVVDAKCAVRFLRAHANELGINPQRIGVYGVSEGGYLASMLGLSGPDAGFEKGQYLNQSSRVQAVVDMWGPADLTDWRGTPSWVYTLENRSRIHVERASFQNQASEK
jgi:acetyl esterase/lipase